MAGIATIKITASYKGLGEASKFEDESITSGLKVVRSETGLLSTQSTTIDKGVMSAGIYGIIIANYSTTQLNSTASAGLFVFQSGQTYLSGQIIPDGEFIKMRQYYNGRGIHLYAPRGGNSFQFTAFGV